MKIDLRPILHCKVDEHIKGYYSLMVLFQVNPHMSDQYSERYVFTFEDVGWFTFTSEAII